MSDSPILDLVWQLWPQLRDRGTVDDPADLDRLLVTAGRPGAPGYDCGVRRSFECFPPDREATFVLPTGERPVRVAYFKVVVGDREEAKSTAEIADYFEVELSSTKTIGIRLIQLCPPIELTAEQAKNLEENPPDTLACFENIALGLPDYA